MGAGQSCTKKFLDQGTKLHEDNFARVTFLHESKKKTEK